MTKNKEERPEGVEIGGNGALEEVAIGTSTGNEVSPEDRAALDDTIESTEQEQAGKGAPSTDGKKPISANYYKAFANSSLTAVDKLFEFVMAFAVEPEISTDGIKKRDPEDFMDNVNLLAEQLELTQVQISQLLGWLVFAGVIGASYAKVGKQILKENKALKNQKKGNITNHTHAASPVKTDSDNYTKEEKEELLKAAVPKRGNWRYHAQPCPCIQCLNHRDKKGNILEEANIVE